MATRTYIRQIDRFICEDPQGRRFGIQQYAEFVESSNFWRTVVERRDVTYRLADGCLLSRDDAGRFVNAARGVLLKPCTPSRSAAAGGPSPSQRAAFRRGASPQPA